MNFLCIMMILLFLCIVTFVISLISLIKDIGLFNKILFDLIQAGLVEKVEVPNETTVKAIEEADEMVKNGCGGYDNLDDLWSVLNV